MNTVNHILSEQSQADTNKLNVLFIGDEEIKERSSFAKRLIASRQINGDIKFKYQGNSDKLLEILQGNIADNFDLVVFFCSGIYESNEYNETIENLEIAISICKNLDIPIIIFTFPQYNFIRDKKQETRLKELEPERQRVNQWIKQGADADYVIDLDFKLDEMSTFFSVYGDRIGSDGHAIIARKLTNIIKNLDDNIDDSEIDTTGINNLITGNSLRVIQKLLVNLGYKIKFSEIRTNKFGLSTKKAVAAFQLKNGLLPTGDIDLKTVKRLKSPDAIPFSSSKSKQFNNIERAADKKDKKSIKTGDGVITIGKAGTSADALAMARNLMRDLDLTEAQAAGIVGNMVAESGVENARPQGTKPGVKGPLVVDGVTGYGIVQWTSINRQQALADFATAEGADLAEPLSMDIEYQFFIKELLGDYKTVYDRIRENDDVKESSTIFMQQYERPAGYDTESKINARYELSKQIYDKLVGGEGTETETAEDDVSVLDAAGNIIKGIGAGILGLGTIAAINYAHKLEYNPSSGFRSHARPTHEGVDYHASKGTPVVLTQAGTIVRTNTGCNDEHDAKGNPVNPRCGGGWGNFVQVKFADGAFCTFGHFTTVGVASGKEVEPGTVIGTVGDTGHSYGAHLHFEYTAPGSSGKSAGTPSIAEQYFGFGTGGTETPYESPTVKTVTPTTNTKQPKNASKSIVIGDSLVPYVAAQCDAKPLSATPSVKSLHTGGKGTSWLSNAVGQHPLNTSVTNVIIVIGTNDIYSSAAPIESLVSNLRMTFPRAKLLVVQGNYGVTATWSKALTTVTQKQVDAFYGRFKSMGVTVIRPAIGGLKEPHGHYPIYKTIGANINKELK
jgi:murein DD-endopeptidase MepM/ murein hydrolase activator NlpD